MMPSLFYRSALLFLILTTLSLAEVLGADFHTVPFSTNTTHLTIWNGREYEPFFVKGVNLGVAQPGRFPGELEVTRGQYAQWFQLVNEAGFNTLRLYTLHYPHFYEVLDSFNLANPQNPLYFFQGVWLEEELDGYSGDLYHLTDFFFNEIEENVDCVHGNRVIPHRFGKAYGTYATDVSRWNMGYIIGREIYGEEVHHTNVLNGSINSYTGNHLSIEDAEPSEAWAVSALDHLIHYEFNSYGVFRPVSFSSWPTLDPLDHPDEPFFWEDAAKIDLNEIILTNAPAGYFASYHIYPYFPAFISHTPEYQEFEDDYGMNPYLGYLTDLKQHYTNIPLIVAEFGIPSSWGTAKFGIGGMNHGGFDEWEQGNMNLRLLKSIETANAGGGIYFSIIDEWFKTTWINYVDFMANRRPFWHNVTSPEQNYGLLGFKSEPVYELWESFCNDCPVHAIKATSDHAYFHLSVLLDEPFTAAEGMWISLDTYLPDVGESILPGGHVVSNRAEFALHITNHSAQLYVTRAYDIFGFFNTNNLNPGQVFQSVVSDGAPWQLVKWKLSTFSPYDIDYIGNLNLNYHFFPENTHDAVRVFLDKINIRIPWALLQFVDPSQRKVLHDNIATSQIEYMESDGISVSVFYQGEEFTPQDRYLWDEWNVVESVQQYPKGSYFVMKDRLHEFNNRAIAVCDTFYLAINGEPAVVGNTEGVLANDFDLDGNFMQALVLQAPKYGRLQLNPDGSFVYEPFGEIIWKDSFQYVIFDGHSLSEAANVQLYINVEVSIPEHDIALHGDKPLITTYPNPATNRVMIRADDSVIDQVSVFDVNGRLLTTEIVGANSYRLGVSHLPSGVYFLKIKSAETMQVKKIQVFQP
ncbi:MAG: T9SS C-terminal target domain-containing protein [Bacteroidetes bacterium]|nr:MAG: T9SS C-terminal target domain-containing protein [Bacteroidota bacterium]